MNQNNHPAIKHKLGLLELADQLKNVSRACKVMGVSRDTFYRVQSAFEEGGIDALLAKSKKIPKLKKRFVSWPSITLLLVKPESAMSCESSVYSFQEVGFVASGNGITLRPL